MASIEKFIKIPDAKWAIYVITGGAVLLVAAKILDSVYQAQIFSQQKKLNTYRLSEYAAKYGEIKDGTIIGNVEETATNTLNKIV